MLSTLPFTLKHVLVWTVKWWLLFLQVTLGLLFRFPNFSILSQYDSNLGKHKCVVLWLVLHYFLLTFSTLYFFFIGSS